MFLPKVTMGHFSLKNLIAILKSKNFLVTLSFFLIAFIYLYKYLLTSNEVVPYAADYKYYTTYASYQLNCIEDYSQFPLWSNMQYMGYPLYADWTSNIYYPLTMPFFAAFGPVMGLKIIIFVHISLCGVGFWYFSKFLTDNKLPRYFGALLFMLCGALANRMGAGHLNHIIPFPWIPITMYFLHSTLETRRLKYAIFSSISMSFFILASVALFIYFGFLFVIFALFQVFRIDGNSKFKIKLNKWNLLILGTVAMLGALLCAIKVVPILNFSSVASRPHDPLYASVGFGDIVSFFVDQTPASDFPRGLTGFIGYYYLGLVPLIFVPFSMFHTSPHRKYLIVALIVSVFWAMGYFTVFGVIHLFSVFQNLSGPPTSLMIGTFCIASLIVLGFDWFMKRYSSLSPYKKKYVCLFFMSIMVITTFEMITPFLVYILFPENYKLYVYFTRNEFTIATLIASILVTLIVLITVTRILYRYNIKEFIFCIFKPKTFKKTISKAFLSTNFVSIVLIIFVTVNLLVVNSRFIETRPLWHHEEKLEEIIADDIIADDPEYRPWTFDKSYWLVDKHILSYDIPMTNTHVASYLRYQTYYYPWNITLGNTTYVPHIYEITDEVDKENATIVNKYTVINESLLQWTYLPTGEDKTEGGFTDAEPRDMSQLFSKLGSTNETTPENITIYLYRLNNTLPDVFIIRNEVIIPLEVSENTPLRIVAKTSDIRSDDIIVLKNTYYPGWKISINNGDKKDTKNFQRLISYEFGKDIMNATIIFTFEPEDFTISIIITAMFFPAIAILYFIIRKGYISFLMVG